MQRLRWFLPVLFLGWLIGGCGRNASNPASRTPLARATSPATPTFFYQATQPGPILPTPTAAPTQEGATPQPTTATPSPLCGSVEEMTILAVGAYPRLYGLADAVRIVKVDFRTPRVVVVALPRDLRVDLPWGAPFPSPVKLASAYLLGTPVFLKNAPEDGGARMLAATIEYNFGIRVDRYLVVSKDGVAEFVNALGGIPVDIPYPLYDPASRARFEPGHYVLDGNDVIRLARSRRQGGDLARIERQTWILQGLLKRLSDPKTLLRLPQIVQALQGTFITNLRPSDLDNLFCLLAYMLQKGLTPNFVSPPEDLLRGMKDYIYLRDQIVVAYVFDWDDTFVAWLHRVLEEER